MRAVAKKPIPRTSILIVFIAIALTAALYAITAHPGSGKPATPRAALAAGTLSIGNSVSGAVLNASGMVPGGPASQGTVTITNTGSLAGDFSLSQNVTGGSRLANLLHVVIVDTTASKTVYDGSVAGMPG